MKLLSTPEQRKCLALRAGCITLPQMQDSSPKFPEVPRSVFQELCALAFKLRAEFFRWVLRGLLDKMVRGVGLNRGRTHVKNIEAGDAWDFWRVLVAETEAKRLRLFAEMRLPGEAWLEFQIIATKGRQQLTQTATFRPRGVLGRLYWYAVLPLHHFIFKGMLEETTRSKPVND